uniref:MYB-IF35 n=2 Tax=Arundo donax TaxID=35708 RepID=A0A0A9FWY5_ARUDO
MPVNGNKRSNSTTYFSTFSSIFTVHQARPTDKNATEALPHLTHHQTHRTLRQQKLKRRFRVTVYILSRKNRSDITSSCCPPSGTTMSSMSHTSESHMSSLAEMSSPIRSQSMALSPSSWATSPVGPPGPLSLSMHDPSGPTSSFGLPGPRSALTISSLRPSGPSSSPSDVTPLACACSSLWAGHGWELGVETFMAASSSFFSSRCCCSTSAVFSFSFSFFTFFSFPPLAPAPRLARPPRRLPPPGSLLRSTLTTTPSRKSLALLLRCEFQ